MSGTFSLFLHERTIQNKVYTVDTLGTWAEVHDVQGESQRTELVQPKEEKVHCYVRIPNARMHRRQSQTLLSFNTVALKRQKAQARILTRYKEKKFRMEVVKR